MEKLNKQQMQTLLPDSIFECHLGHNRSGEGHSRIFKKGNEFYEITQDGEIFSGQFFMNELLSDEMETSCFQWKRQN